MGERLKKLVSIIVFCLFLGSLSACNSFGSIFNGKKRVQVHQSKKKKAQHYAKRDKPKRKSRKINRANIVRGMFEWPYRGTVTSHFGERWGRNHYGLDISAKIGTEVRAAAQGKVIYVGQLGGYGNLVLIKHKKDFYTAYAHNSKFKVKKGKKVKQGQVVALSGNTGKSTGPHIHFEIRKGADPQDPLPYLPRR